MARLIDLTGQRFGRLAVTRRGPNTDRGEAQWHCLCDCGAEALVMSQSLRAGDTRSCGCLFRESRRERKCQKCGAFRPKPEYDGEYGRVCNSCRVGKHSSEKRQRSKVEPGVDAATVNLARMKW